MCDARSTGGGSRHLPLDRIGVTGWLRQTSGAARIPTIRMRPLSLPERLEEPGTVGLADLLSGERPELRGGEQHGARGLRGGDPRPPGFPGLRGLPARALRTQLESYVDRIVDRDFPELGHQPRTRPACADGWPPMPPHHRRPRVREDPRRRHGRGEREAVAARRGPLSSHIGATLGPRPPPGLATHPPPPLAAQWSAKVSARRPGPRGRPARSRRRGTARRTGARPPDPSRWNAARRSVRVVVTQA